MLCCTAGIERCQATVEHDSLTANCWLSRLQATAAGLSSLAGAASPRPKNVRLAVLRCQPMLLVARLLLLDWQYSLQAHIYKLFRRNGTKAGIRSFRTP